MKSIIFIFLLSSIFFTACTSKNATNYFKHDTTYANSLQYTKSTTIKDKNEVKAIFIATYLNKIDEKFDDKQYDQFIVGTYIKDGYVNLYTLTLNLLRPHQKEPFDENHPLYGKLPLFNKWASYQIIKFKKQKDVKKLMLKMKHLSLGTAKLYFEAN
jgi:hypothetical protein